MTIPIEVLRCVVCRGGTILQISGDRLACSNCGHSYEVTPSGIPVMLTPEDQSLFAQYLATPVGNAMVEQYRGTGARSRLTHFVRRLLKPPVSFITNPSGEYTLGVADGFVLSIGGGGSQAKAPGTDWLVNLNIGPFPGVDIVGNGAVLPFQDCTFDVVVCDAVLEHVAEAGAVVEEAHRVLRNGGRVHAVVPFLHPFHGYPTDFQRYTALGLEELFAKFRKDAVEVRQGPSASLIAFCREYAKLLLPDRFRGNRFLHAAVGGLVEWVLFPIKYLDHYLNEKADAHLLANHLYFTGTKQ